MKALKWLGKILGLRSDQSSQALGGDQKQSSLSFRPEAPTGEQTEEASSGVPKKTKSDMVNEVLFYTCTQKCCGVVRQSSKCCTISDRDWILGSVKDTDRFLADLSKLKGREVPYDEVFVDFEEGSQMFPDKPSWQAKKNYPAMRVHVDRSKGHPCTLLGDDLLCSVHTIKPAICKNYYCEYLQYIKNIMEKNL
ncbi:MAG: hypothetical protein K2Z81_22050 [Cyanobacteria bacterium]|nr:hypothetical protein [Cyanobacteriota bacterium]